MNVRNNVAIINNAAIQAGNVSETDSKIVNKSASVASVSFLYSRKLQLVGILLTSIHYAVYAHSIINGN